MKFVIGYGFWGFKKFEAGPQSHSLLMLTDLDVQLLATSQYHICLCTVMLPILLLAMLPAMQ